MVIQAPYMENTEYIIPVRACKTCGTRKRFTSNGNCVHCKRVSDAARTDDRRSKRKKCEDALMVQGYNLGDMSRREKDYLIATTFPLMQAYFRDVLNVAWWMPQENGKRSRWFE